MTPCIAIIDSNTLAAQGLRSLLGDMFVGVDILEYRSVEQFVADANHYFVHFFVRDQILFSHADEFDMLKRQTFVLTEGPGRHFADAGFLVLDCSQTEQEIVRTLLHYHRMGHPSGHPSGVRLPESVLLSDREKEILALMVRGLINKEIADRLGISVTTVIFHRNNICAKFGTRSLGRLTVHAVLSGLVDIDTL